MLAKSASVFGLDHDISGNLLRLDSSFSSSVTLKAIPESTCRRRLAALSRGSSLFSPLPLLRSSSCLVISSSLALDCSDCFLASASFVFVCCKSASLIAASATTFCFLIFISDSLCLSSLVLCC